MDFGTIVLIALILLALIAFFKTIRIVPQRSAFIVERLGKYRATLEAGFHVLTPFVDKVAYRHTLKEQAVDVRLRPASRRTTSRWKWTAFSTCR